MLDNPRKAEVARAVVLYGRVGTYATRTASLKKGMPGDQRLWKNCALSIAKHVVQPWRMLGTVDVFVQSWNLELADSMNAHWQPRASDHAQQNESLGRCPVKLNYCDRTMWALLGMKRALSLRTRWAARTGGAPHATVLVMRHDVLWKAALPPLRADRAVRLWLPFDCQTSHGRSAVEGQWDRLNAARTVLGVKCYAGDEDSRAYTFCDSSVNIDWWWAGDVALADGFSQTFDNFAHYSRLVRWL